MTGTLCRAGGAFPLPRKSPTVATVQCGDGRAGTNGDLIVMKKPGKGELLEKYRGLETERKSITEQIETLATQGRTIETEMKRVATEWRADALRGLVGRTVVIDHPDITLEGILLDVWRDVVAIRSLE